MNKIALSRKRANRLLEWCDRNGHDVTIKIDENYVTVYIKRQYYLTLEIYKHEEFRDLKPIKTTIEKA